MVMEMIHQKEGRFEKDLEEILLAIETKQIQTTEEIVLPNNAEKAMEEIIAPPAYVTDAFYDIIDLLNHPYKKLSSATLRQKKIFLEQPYKSKHTSGVTVLKIIYRRKTLHSRIIKLLRKFLEEKEVYDKYSITGEIIDHETPPYDPILIKKEGDQRLLEEILHHDPKMSHFLKEKGNEERKNLSFEELFEHFLEAYEAVYEPKNKAAVLRLAKALQKKERKSLVDISEHIYHMPLHGDDILRFDVSFQRITHKSGDAMKVGIIHTNESYYHQMFLNLLTEKEGAALQEIDKEKNLFFVDNNGKHYYVAPFGENYLIFFKPEKTDDFLTFKKEKQFVRDYYTLLEKTFGVEKKNRPTGKESSLSLLLEKTQLFKIKEKKLSPEEEKIINTFISDWYFSLQTTKEGRKEDRRFFHELFEKSIQERIFYPYEDPEHFKGKDYINFPKKNGYQSGHMIFKRNHRLLDVHLETPLMSYRNKYGGASHDRFAEQEKALLHLLKRYETFKGKERTRLLLGLFHKIGYTMKKTYEKILTRKPIDYMDLLNKINALRWYWEAEQEFIHPVNTAAKKMLNYKYAHEKEKDYLNKPLPIQKYLLTLTQEIATYFEREHMLTQEERIQKMNQVMLYYLSQEYLKTSPKGKAYITSQQRQNIVTTFVDTMTKMIQDEVQTVFHRQVPKKDQQKTLEMFLDTGLQSVREYRDVLPKQARALFAERAYSIGFSWMKSQGLMILDRQNYRSVQSFFTKLSSTLQEEALPLQDLKNLFVVNYHLQTIARLKEKLQEKRKNIKYYYFLQQALDETAKNIPKKFGYLDYSAMYKTLEKVNATALQAVQSGNFLMDIQTYQQTFCGVYNKEVMNVQSNQFKEHQKRYRHVLNKDMSYLEQEPTFLLIKDLFLNTLSTYLPFK